MSNVLSLPSVGPYVGVSRDAKRGRYRILVYGAYNACGLIGSEHNGICVLDDEDLQVVADRLAQVSSGYYGPAALQIKAFEHLLTCSPQKFADYINRSGRNRFEIDPATVPTAQRSQEAQPA